MDGFALVAEIHEIGEADLFEIVNTLYGVRLGLRAPESRQEHRGQDGNDRNDNEKFDERKSYGRYKGREWALRGHWLHITPKRLDSADRWFARYGDWAVLLSRCLPIIRTFISLPAGIARMPFWRFTILTVVGCIPWVLMLTLAGRAVGDNWEDLQKQLHYFDYALILILVGTIVWLVVRQRRRRRPAEA